MAAGRIVISEFAPARDRNDALVAGAKMYVYTNGTTTLASIYTSATLTTALANPVVANSSGQFAQVWADASLTYTVSITGPNGESIGNPSVFDGYSPSTNFAVSEVDEYKAPVRVASTANITIASALINGSTIDGVVVATGDRVLLKDQSGGLQNGIYVVVATGAASRSGDADTSAKVTSGMTMFVSEGTANGGATFTLTTANTITLDTTALTFSRFSGALGAGVATFLATPSSANLAAAVTDETGTGALVFANSPVLVTPALGTPASGVLTNATGLPVAGIAPSTTTALGVGSVELGHATDTTLTRSSAGNVAVEGNLIYRAGGTDVPVADGGTGSSTAADARTALAVVGTAELAASGGSALVGFLNAGTGTLARTAQARFRDSVSVKDFTGALGNGTAADTGFAAARVEALANGIKRIIIPAGHYLLTNFAASGDGLIYEGDGEATRLTVGAINSNVITVSGDRNTIRGVKFEGDGTTSAAANGNGALVTGADALFEDVWFSGMGHGGVYGVVTTAKRGPRFVRTRHRTTAAGGTEIFLGGGWQNILIEDADMLTASGADQGILIFNSGAGLWEGAAVRGGWYEGYDKQGIAVADEAWDGTDRVFGFTVDGGYYKNCTQTAIKAKLSKGIRVVNTVIENCGGVPEDAVSGLFGSILLNSIGQIDCSHNTLRNNGDGAITFNGDDAYPTSYPGGQGLASITCAFNIIEGCGQDSATYGNGITLLGRVKSISVDHNDIRTVTRNGIYLDGVVGRDIQFASITNNVVLDSPSASLYGIRLEQIRDLRMDGNRVSNFPVAGVDVTNCGEVFIGGADKSGDSIGAASCYNLSSCDLVMFGGSASCTYYDARADATAYVLGDRRHNGANKVYEVLVAGTTGTGTAPTGSSLTTAYADGTVTWGYVHAYRVNTNGITVSSVGTMIVTDEARFEYSGAPLSAMPTTLKWTNIQTGTATLSAGAVTITFTSIAGVTAAQPDANFRVELTGTANETFYISARTTSGFTITSSNGASTATVFWRAFR